MEGKTAGPPNGLEIRGAPLWGAARPATASIAPKASARLAASVEDRRPSWCFAKRSGGGSFELLDEPITVSRANQKWAGSRSSPFMIRALKQIAWQNHTCHLSLAVVIVK